MHVYGENLKSFEYKNYVKSNEAPLISKAFNKNIIPVIEKLECQIIARGDRVVHGISKKELESLIKDTSNLANVREYLEKWNREDVDINEGLDKEGEEEEFDNDIEIVVTDNEDNEEGEDDEDLIDFIIEDKEDEEDKEEL
jgi:hypothetical protein